MFKMLINNHGFKFLYLSFIFLFFISSRIEASPQVGIVDTNVYPRQADPPTFDVSHKAIDPVFNTTIARITGPVGSNAVYENNLETQNLAPIQHFHNPWSYTGDHFLVWADRLSQGAGARVELYSLDRVNFSVMKVRSLEQPISAFNYNRGVHFDHDNEWIIYAVDTSVIPNVLKRCNLNYHSTEEGLAPDSCENLLSDVDGINQMTQSDDDEFFAYSSENNLVHRVWRRSSRETLITVDCSSWYSCDESQMSPDGKWLFLKGHQVEGDHNAWVYDIQNGGVLRAYDSYGPDYFSGKHSGFNDKWVNETTQFSNYRLVVRNIQNDEPGKNPWTETPKFIFSSPISPVGAIGAIHPSYSNSNYVYGGFFRPAGEPDPWVPYYDEIVRIKDDGTETLRLAHSWSRFYSNSYDEIPSYASPVGDYVIFYSNWNGGDINARHDVFIVSTLDFSDPDDEAPSVPIGLNVI
ncbi:MAG: hypothetical protein V3574_05230 [Candidatus Moraniibacteriota bacterium]